MNFKDIQDKFEAGNYAESLRIAFQGLEKEPLDSKLHQWVADSYLALKDYEAALPFYRKALQLSAPEVDRFIKLRIKKAMRLLKYTSEQQDVYWQSVASEFDLAFQSSYDLLLAGETDSALKAIDTVLPRLFDDEAIRAVRSALPILSRAEKVRLSAIENLRDLPRPKVIMVSGMGWSGSGALFDYFSEFDQVVPIRGETPFISRGRFSLRSIFATLDDSDALKGELFGFFYSNILGFSVPQALRCLKAHENARKLSLSEKHQKRFVRGVKGYAKICNYLLQVEPEGRSAIFSILANYVVRTFCISKYVAPGKYALMDNVVPIQECDSIQFLDNTHLFCTFRDPRSNYCALVNENAAFGHDAKRYVSLKGKSITKCLKLAESAIELAPESSQVIIVQFEEFILSESLRHRLADQIGLKRSTQTEYSRLKPWESWKNVTLHESFPDQDAIALISEKLADFCVDTHDWQQEYDRTNFERQMTSKRV